MPKLCIQLELYTLNDYICDFFASGARLKLESYLSYGDINIFKDEKLVRIYYVHTIKKAITLCDFIDSIQAIEQFTNYDYSEIANEIADFIKTWPCIWHYIHEQTEARNNLEKVF